MITLWSGLPLLGHKIPNSSQMLFREAEDFSFDVRISRVPDPYRNTVLLASSNKDYFGDVYDYCGSNGAGTLTVSFIALSEALLSLFAKPSWVDLNREGRKKY